MTMAGGTVPAVSAPPHATRSNDESCTCQGVASSYCLRYKRAVITAAQCRMARAALRWDAAQLAEQAGVARMTVLRFEAGQTEPTRGTRALLRQAFEAAGIEFRPDGSLRLREQPAEAQAP